MALRSRFIEPILKLTENEVRNALDRTRSLNAEQVYGLADMSQPSRSYFVTHDDRTVSLKAIVTIAVRSRITTYRSTDFQASLGARKLKELGFDVLHLAKATETAAKERHRIAQQRLSRLGQAKFRAGLIKLYKGTCPVTGCSTSQALQAAHLNGVSKSGTDDVENGVLLRADIHNLFDLDLLAISPEDGTVHINPTCSPHYERYRGVVVRFPKGGPTLRDLAQRWTLFQAAL